MSNETSKTLTDLVTPEIVGIFWITTKPLDRSLRGFDQLNYLFDGLLSQFLYGEEKADSRANLFFTDNFNKSFFLAHIKTQGASPSEISGEIDEQVALIQSNALNRNKVLVIQDTDFNWLPDLNKRYSQFQFLPLKEAE